MTRAPEEAFKQAAKLPPSEQDALADAIVAEMRTEEERERLLSSSPDVLEHLADEALAEHRAGRTQRLDPGKL